jgi:hypothetical protein
VASVGGRQRQGRGKRERLEIGRQRGEGAKCRKWKERRTSNAEWRMKKKSLKYWYENQEAET